MKSQRASQVIPVESANVLKLQGVYGLLAANIPGMTFFKQLLRGFQPMYIIQPLRTPTRVLRSGGKIRREAPFDPVYFINQKDQVNSIVLEVAL
ncbi:MAG: hypothetical protein EA342_02915 [Leptolyngbya sp. LCM1.Bin17]|nr:MAG: hypothetical protein EA342_02915 [Leptolyngbya sp. LCM1.Bin17]